MFQELSSINGGTHGKVHTYIGSSVVYINICYMYNV